MHRARFLVLLLGPAVALCAPSAGDIAGLAGTAGKVTYALAWDTSGVAIAADGTWSVINDAGVTVTVTRGWLTSDGVTLVECPHEHDEVEAASDWHLPRLFGTATALAGHTTSAIDPMASASRVESLTPPVARQAGQLADAGEPWCQVHYRIAQAEATSLDLPGDVDLSHTSLYLEGTWQGPDDVAPTPFTVRARLANGALRDLPAEPIGAVVTVRRALGTLFDGVDLSAGEDEVTRQLLTNLGDQLVVEVTP